MRSRIGLLAATAALASGLPSVVAAMPPADDWDIGPVIRGRNYSIGMPPHPTQARDGSLSIEFPVAGSGQVDAMTTAVGPLAGARRITLRYRVDAPRRTRFMAGETPDQPATVSLYFQRAGDNWSGKGRYASYRWYAPGRAVLPLTPGQHTITIGFDEIWTNVKGQPSNLARAGFAEAMQDTASIGIAFGSEARRSHGVSVTGPARFTLLDLDIE